MVIQKIIITMELKIECYNVGCLSVTQENSLSTYERLQ